MDAGEKADGEFVVAGGDCAKLLEFVEESLNEVALGIKSEIARQRCFAARMRRNHGDDLPLGKLREEGVGVVGHVADQRLRVGLCEQRLCPGEVVGFSWREQDFDRIAERVDECVNLCAQSAARSADRLRAVFFLAPALCWWARTMVASIIMYSLS